MRSFNKGLVIQTAFLGDLILTLPSIQVVKKLHPGIEIDLIARADAAGVAANHPSISKVISYDKRGGDSGFRNFIELAGRLRREHYDFALVPHRSIRSALLPLLAGIPVRIGFDRSAGRSILTNIIRYDRQRHEYRRNLDLIQGLGDTWEEVEYPRLYPSITDAEHIEAMLAGVNVQRPGLVAIAPGTLWNTKRWLPERFAEVAKTLHGMGFSVALIGGPGDAELCSEVARMAGAGTFSTAGKCSILQSAELIRRSVVLLTNDSAPLHLGVAMGTPVAAIFGATTPSFGFSPYGPRDIVIENNTLTCRPCAIHGGPSCPIKTFECMKGIGAAEVVSRILQIVNQPQNLGGTV